MFLRVGFGYVSDSHMKGVAIEHPKTHTRSCVTASPAPTEIISAHNIRKVEHATYIHLS